MNQEDAKEIGAAIMSARKASPKLAGMLAPILSPKMYNRLHEEIGVRIGLAFLPTQEEPQPTAQTVARKLREAAAQPHEFITRRYDPETAEQLTAALYFIAAGVESLGE